MNSSRLLPVILTLAALTMAMSAGRLEAFAADRLPLIEATLADDIGKVRDLLAGGVDPNLFDANRNTALIFAARDGRTEIARMLIGAGADPDWIDGEGVTPLILASLRNHVAIVKMLLAENVDRDRRDRWGRTAIDYAGRRGRDDAIFRLLSE